MWNREFEYVTDNSKLSEIALDLMLSPILGFDVESTSLDPKTSTLLTVQLATPDKSYVFDARRVDLTDLMHTLSHYRDIVVVQNGEFDLRFLYHNYGFWWTSPKYFDTFIAHRLKNVGAARTYAEKFVGLEELCAGYLDYPVPKEVRESFQYVEDGLADAQIEYAAQDAAILIPLYQSMKDKIYARQPETILNLEFNLLPVTASMKYAGIKPDPELWFEIADEKEKRQEEVKQIFQKRMEPYGWGDINPNSWQQLKKAFAVAGLNLPNTELITFKLNKHKLPDLIEPLIEYKELKQPTTTFGKPWLRHIAEDGRVYADFNQVGTDTGRYSCSGPNLQNIPVRNDKRYRHAFVAEDGYKILTADLSQIEYRIAGEFASFQAIIDEYNKSDPDFHRLTTGLVNEYLKEKIDRDTGKRVNFALLYQAGPYKLVEVLGCNRSTSKTIHTAYWKGLEPLKQYMKTVGFQSRVRGYAETKWGRRRYFILPQGAKKWMISAAEREAGNMPIQGTAADILKAATLYMFPKLNYYNARMINQVHDETIIEAPEDVVDDVNLVIKEAFEQAGAQVLERVPTVVEVKVGDTWTK